MPTFTSLAEDLVAQAKQLDAFIANDGIESPSFDRDTLADVKLSEELRSVRSALANSANDLKKLALGPVVFGTELAHGWTDTLALRFIDHFNLASQVPQDGSTTYAALAAAVSLPEPLVFRFVRAAMVSDIFDETPSGEVRHTAISPLLANSPGFADIAGLEVEELAPAGSSYIAALEKWGAEALLKEPSKTAFALANEVEMPNFAYLAERPERARRFGGAMQYWTQDDSWDLRHIAAAFDWSSLDRPTARIVDVGGGHGAESTYIARRTKEVRFLVQALPHVVIVAKNEQLAAEDEGLTRRIEFQTHNFLTPQPMEEKPDAFLLRWILHDWPEEYCVRILRNLIPALKRGAKILIYEYVFGDKPVKKTTEKTGLWVSLPLDKAPHLQVRQLDLIMAACFNGQERDQTGYRRLLSTADERFILDGFSQPKGSTMTLVEVGWKG
ncbi:MAG: hypothetical protein Q9218_007987 [Villophora microphyllina]